MEEEIVKLIEAYQHEAYGYTPPDRSHIEMALIREEVLNDHLSFFSKGGLLKQYTPLTKALLVKVNAVIDNADLALCLTSKYEYIRERRKKI